MDSVASKIPDVWYDLYVRLIPGTIFIYAILFVVDRFPSIDSIVSAVWCLIVGYIFGFIINPIASFAAYRIESLVGQEKERNKVRPVFPAENREMLVLSKQHAETVGMIACSIFTILVGIIQEFGLPIGRKGTESVQIDTVNYISETFLFVCFVMFLLFAFERAFSAKKRCLQIQKRPEFKT